MLGVIILFRSEIVDFNKKRCEMIQKDDIEKNYVNAPEAAKLLNVSRSRIGKLCLAGRFQDALKIGTSWIIPREAVLNHKPLPPGVKPGTQSKKAKLAAERAAILEKAAEIEAIRTKRKEVVEIFDRLTKAKLTAERAEIQANKAKGE